MGKKVVVINQLNTELAKDMIADTDIVGIIINPDEGIELDSEDVDILKEAKPVYFNKSEEEAQLIVAELTGSGEPQSE